ncbi:hypothetical protein ABPG75_007126 [Micractinium tetrahymenae]
MCPAPLHRQGLCCRGRPRSQGRQGRHPNLSEQHLVDCVGAALNYTSRGCRGGLAEDAFDYVNRGYLTTEVAYGYTAVDTTGCRARRVSTDGAITVRRPGYEVVPGTAEAIMAEVCRKGVAVVCWNVDESFVGYTAGIYPASACKADGINHAMAIVGYSSAERYWIVRNSW